jgi:DNA-binding PadR family transcriptional regulator
MKAARQGERSSDSIRSPVYWTFLGLIIERPDYGYGLVKRFGREYGDAMPLSSNSHIYEALEVLREAGLIEEYGSSGGRRQPTVRYRATLEGVRAYRDWLIERVRGERLRSRVFARQLAALASEPELGLEVIDSYERACLQEAELGAIGPTSLGELASGRVGSLAAALTGEQARLAGGVELPWAEYARACFTRLMKTRIPDEPA